jgi:hypothetical protein
VMYVAHSCHPLGEAFVTSLEAMSTGLPTLAKGKLTGAQHPLGTWGPGVWGTLNRDGRGCPQEQVSPSTSPPFACFVWPSVRDGLSDVF